MSKENASRRNRALRKVRASRRLPPQIKEAIQVVIDLMSPKSGYNAAWPSAATIAERSGRKRRMGQRYVKVIKSLGIFDWKQLRPQDAQEFLLNEYGIKARFDQCRGQAPNIFLVNRDHPLWNNERKLPQAVDEEMGIIVRQILAESNKKTTSRLSSNPAKRPSSRSHPLRKYPERLREFDASMQLDFSAADAHELQGAERWCREELLSSVANGIPDGVANDIQVFEKSSESANMIAFPERCFQS